jgi:hypothetical protein
MCPSAAPIAISLAQHEVDTCSWTTGDIVGQYLKKKIFRQKQHSTRRRLFSPPKMTQI